MTMASSHTPKAAVELRDVAYFDRTAVSECDFHTRSQMNLLISAYETSRDHTEYVVTSDEGPTLTVFLSSAELERRRHEALAAIADEKLGLTPALDSWGNRVQTLVRQARQASRG
jgi:hypothetical protein